jgi:hydrogenase maturation protease
LRSERQRPAKKRPLGPRAKRPPRRTLVLGIGNPGRADDGLGARAVEIMDALCLPGVRCDANYQLNVEDALSCSEHDVVIFVDAARGLRVPFTWTGVKAKAAPPAMTHALGPEAVLAVCETLYGKMPEAYLLGIRGHRWGIREGLSPRAKTNLREAVGFLEAFVRRKRPGKGHGS